MNSYNDNLHSSVVTSLNNQWLSQRMVLSQKNAATFSLFYAQGATITANEKVEDSEATLRFKKKVRQQAVRNSNLTNNVLSAETQASQHMGQSVTNTALSASNVQAAATALLRLAGDVGNIYSILYAADYDQDIAGMAKQIHSLMNDTAYHAETTSQFAMEASMLTAEVSFATVLDSAKSTNALMNQLLQISSTDYNAVSQQVNDNHTTLAQARINEKLAEANLEDIRVDYHSHRDAYKKTNEELNLKLIATPDKSAPNSTIIVSFDQLINPFEEKGATDSDDEDSLQKYGINNESGLIQGELVQDYYIILVKETSKSTFSLSDAENLYTPPGSDKCILVTSKPEKDSNGNVLPGIQQSISIVSGSDNENNILILKDSDGENITTGISYVAFILAVYTEKHKKFLNAFDDFLSAPSIPFTLATPLATAQYITAKQNTISFNAPKLAPDKTASIEYRCLFLPSGLQVPPGLLSQDSLEALDSEVNSIESIETKYQPQITKWQGEIASLQIEQTELKSRLASLQKNTINSDTTEIEKQITENQGKLDNWAENSDNLVSEAGNTFDTILGDTVVNNLPFYFNQVLAENVPASNYCVAVPAKQQDKSSDDAGDTTSLPQWTVSCNDSTTDVFGNLLIDLDLSIKEVYTYKPVILSFSTAPEQNVNKYTNALSDYKQSPNFIYTSKPSA